MAIYTIVSVSITSLFYIEQWYRKLLGLCRRSSASEIFVMNNISNFEALSRKSIFAFKTRLSNLDNTIMCTLQSSWVITYNTQSGKWGKISYASKPRSLYCSLFASRL